MLKMPKKTLSQIYQPSFVHKVPIVELHDLKKISNGGPHEFKIFTDAPPFAYFKGQS